MKNIVILKRVGVLSFAKLNTIFMFFVGILAAIMSLVMGMLFKSAMTSIGSQSSVPASMGASYLVLLIFPVFYAIIGFVSGALMAWGYNQVVKFAGGLEIELGEKSVKPVIVKEKNIS